MTNKLVLASAGSGKTTEIITDAIRDSKDGNRVLILTYTLNNQNEILKKICQIEGAKPACITIKGWFAFLLEDMIRPYQSCIFKDRISNILFDNSNPHKRNGRNIPGRREKVGSGYNADYYLGKAKEGVHTTFISQLAARISEETRPRSATGRQVRGSRGKSIQRLEDIFSCIYIDEVQDLVGWDYYILDLIAKSPRIDFTCVGDFRQTIYETATTTKAPRRNLEKIGFFAEMGLSITQKNVSRRCVQSICNFADEIHNGDGYEPTISKVKKVPDGCSGHVGVFAVRECDIEAYFATFDPVILRADRNSRSDLCQGRHAKNYGESKGLGFDRTLIFPTDPYRRYLTGDRSGIVSGKTDLSRNRLYVAVTRARYSAAFLYEGDVGVHGMEIWNESEE